MIKRTTTLWLMLLVLFLGSLLLILDNRERDEQTRTRNNRVFDITTNPIGLIGMIVGDAHIEVVRKGENWFLQKPIRARASNIVVKRLAANAERLRSLDRISEEQRDIRNLTLSDYGLDDPEGTLYIETDGRRETMSLGSPTPFGRGIYGYLHNSGNIVMLPEEALSLFSLKLDDLRDRTIFSGSKRRVTRIDIQRRDIGFLQLIRRNDDWYIQQPLAWRADPDAINQLLDRLYVLQVQQFVWDAPAQAADGLQNPEFRSAVERTLLAADQVDLRVTVWLEGRDTGEELFIGKAHESAEGQFYARRGGVPAVFTVPATLVENISKQVNTFRDNRMLPPNLGEVLRLGIEYQDARLSVSNDVSKGTWVMSEPVPVEANPSAIQDVLRKMKALRISSFDEAVAFYREKPLLEITLDIQGADEGDVVQHILQLQHQPEETTDARWIGRMGREGDWFPMSGFVSDAELVSLLEPARYRTRKVFTLPAVNVNWVQQSTERGVVTMALTQNEQNTQWKVVEPESRELDLDALRRVLAVLLKLEAQEVVALDPPTLEPYGLHAPETTISIRFSDENQLQRSVLISRSPENHDVYARQQGYGFVYKLDPQVASILEQNVLIPAPPEMPQEANTNSLNESQNTNITNAVTTPIPILPLRDTP